YRATLGPIRACLAPDRMERILGDLLGRLGTSEHPVDESEHDTAVVVIELAEGIGVAAGHPGHEASIFTRLIAGYEVIGRHGSPTWSRPYGPGAVDTRLLRRSPDPTPLRSGIPLAGGCGICLSSDSRCRRPVPGLPGRRRPVGHRVVPFAGEPDLAAHGFERIGRRAPVVAPATHVGYRRAAGEVDVWSDRLLYENEAGLRPGVVLRHHLKSRERVRR